MNGPSAGQDAPSSTREEDEQAPPPSLGDDVQPLLDPTEDSLLDDEAYARHQRIQRVKLAAITMAGLLLVGGIPWLLGFGPFASRLIFADDIPVHVINQSGSPLDIEISYAQPLQLPSGHQDTTTALTGPLRIVARHADTGETLETLDIRATGPLFYNALGGTCLVVFDLSDMYGGRGGPMRILARLTPEDRIWTITSDTFVRPRHPPPEQAIGSVHWIEDFRCDLVREAEDHFLLGRAEIRMNERLEILEEHRRRLQQSQ